MGYHANEATTKKAVGDACRFLNDRERVTYALYRCLLVLGLDRERTEKAIKEIRACDFTEIDKLEGITEVD